MPALAVLFAPVVLGQGIIYVHAPLSNPNGDPNHLPWDSLGTQVGPDFPIIINGQTVLTFSAPLVVGQPSKVIAQPSLTSSIIGQQPFLDFPDDVWVVPLSAGTEIGPDAAGYNWFDGSYDGPLLTAATGSGTVGDPFLTAGYFTGLESAYLGFDFQQNGETYYGWAQIGCPVVGLNAGWIYDYAYETAPNMPIEAGAVPEPSAFALIVIGISLLGFRCHKK
ncbi:MAG: PEP-CTERM sorting domain-containing protein [Limisphaerales bacterium]